MVIIDATRPSFCFEPNAGDYFELAFAEV
jgi:hypothetical protein